MSYTQAGNLLNYFMPNIPLATTDAGVMQEIDIGAATADHGEYVCYNRCTLQRPMFALTGELAGGSSTAPTVLFKKRPTPLSATGETTVATLTIPDATAVGKVVYQEVDVDFDVGDSLEISHTIGVGTPTGQGHATAYCTERPEDPRSEADMLLSTT